LCQARRLKDLYRGNQKDPPIDSGFVDDELRDVIYESFLSQLPDDAVAALVQGVLRFEVPTGTLLRYCGPEERPYAFPRLVADGLLRIVRSGPTVARSPSATNVAARSQGFPASS